MAARTTSPSASWRRTATTSFRGASRPPKNSSGPWAHPCGWWRGPTGGSSPSRTCRRTSRGCPTARPRGCSLPSTSCRLSGSPRSATSSSAATGVFRTCRSRRTSGPTSCAAAAASHSGRAWGTRMAAAPAGARTRCRHAAAQRLVTLHGDFHAGNLLVGPSGALMPIDFEFTSVGPAVLDLAYAVGFIGENSAKHHFVEAYLAARGYDAADEAGVDLLIADCAVAVKTLWANGGGWCCGASRTRPSRTCWPPSRSAKPTPPRFAPRRGSKS
mmetsp:Transcript_49713/g.142679  ORF Transcript_49713/g.142679 Transcript_49713/m.142679 type:complete len:272 (+) Transcript_49713:202-1017(+)